jgi:hypothetical protein
MEGVRNDATEATNSTIVLLTLSALQVQVCLPLQMNLFFGSDTFAPLPLYAYPLLRVCVHGMDSELHPLFAVRSGTFSICMAPGEALVGVLRAALLRERLRTLYICGNYSRVLSHLDRRYPDFHVRRAFTVFQLLTILEEADESMIIIEHDPSLYDDVPEIVRHVGMALLDRAQHATVLLVSTGFDPVLGALSGWAHRVMYIECDRSGTHPAARRRAVPVRELPPGQTGLAFF